MLSSVFALLLFNSFGPSRMVGRPPVVQVYQPERAGILKELRTLGYKNVSLNLSSDGCLVVSIGSPLTEKEVKKIFTSLPYANYYLLDQNLKEWFISEN